MAVSVQIDRPKISIGQRYRVVIEGLCGYISDENFDLDADFISVGGIEMDVNSASVVSVEHLPGRLKVGTEIHGESPLPVPIGTVLRSADGVVMEKTPYGWQSPGSPIFLRANPTGRPSFYPLTVLYVPEETP